MRNRGELAEGWYDAVTLRKARASAASTAQIARRYEPSGEGHQDVGDVSSDDDAVGPALPGDYTGTKEGKRSGPAIPNLQDLELQRGMSSLEYKLALNAILEQPLHDGELTGPPNRTSRRRLSGAPGTRPPRPPSRSQGAKRASGRVGAAGRSRLQRADAGEKARKSRQPPRVRCRQDGHGRGRGCAGGGSVRRGRRRRRRDRELQAAKARAGAQEERTRDPARGAVAGAPGGARAAGAGVQGQGGEDDERAGGAGEGTI